ncbi:MAG: signal peptidase I [Acetatifactor sp.]|nr:signal peptidase I [Acetatifactor sp.]
MARNKGLSFYRRKKKINNAVIREIFNWFFGIFASVFLALVGVYFFGMSVNVVGISMEDTLYNAQKILVNRFVYIITSPKINDCVVFLPKGNENTHYYVKRVVGVPGDTLYIADGVLYVNGKPSELYENGISDPGILSVELTLKSGEYFCIGDNPDNSEDSRSANIGVVRDEYLVGKAWFKFKCPGGKAGFID